MNKKHFGTNKNIIGGQLRNYRKSRHLTQSELAAKMQTMDANIDQKAVSFIERNLRAVTDYEFACFCIVLEIEPHEMLKDFYKTIEAQSNLNRE